MSDSSSSTTKPNYLTDTIIKLVMALLLASGAWLISDFREDVTSLEDSLNDKIPTLTDALNSLSREMAENNRDIVHRDAKIKELEDIAKTTRDEQLARTSKVQVVEDLVVEVAALKIKVSSLQETVKDMERQIDVSTQDRFTLTDFLSWILELTEFNPDLTIPKVK